MKFSLKYFLLAAAALMAFVGCKDDDEESIYLDGSITVDFVDSDGIPLYVEVGRQYTIVPSGLSADDAKVGYYLTNPKTSEKDTIMTPEHPATSFFFEIPDTLTYLTLSITGFAYDTETSYYSTSTSTGFYAVNPELNTGSITGFNTNSATASIGGKKYYVATIGGKTWMRQNLSYFGKGGVEDKEFGATYYDSDDMADIFGGFYTWNEAQKACPDGWHLPTDAEWCEMLTAAGAKEAKVHENVYGVTGKLISPISFNGDKMWEYWGFDLTDATQFSAMPVGYATGEPGSYTFSTLLEYACFWTADEYNGHGVYRYIKKDKDIVYVGTAEKDAFLASVRCVK